MPILRSTPLRASGFSLVELLVVIAIVALLSIVTYAPYSYYGDLSRVKSSAERVEQALSEAKLEASMGLVVPGTENNADAYVVFEEGSGSVAVFAAKAGTGFANPSGYVPLRSVPLESNVFLTGLPGASVTVKFSAPTGIQSAQVSTSTLLPGSPLSNFTGASVGLRGARTGSLNKHFRTVSY